MADTQSGERDTIKETKEAYQKYAESVGRVALTWNNLHQDLGKIFVNLVSGKRSPNRHVGFAAWYSIRSDRSQRDMLLATLVETLPSDSKILAELKWVFGRISSLEEDRNNLVHSPWTLRLTNKRGYNSVDIAPNSYTGHTRAVKLHGKDISAESFTAVFRISGLRNYVEALSELLPDGELPTSLKRPPWQPPQPPKDS